jgi:hypothetical protein
MDKSACRDRRRHRWARPGSLNGEQLARPGDVVGARAAGQVRTLATSLTASPPKNYQYRICQRENEDRVEQVDGERRSGRERKLSRVREPYRQVENGRDEVTDPTISAREALPLGQTAAEGFQRGVSDKLQGGHNNGNPHYT